MSPLLYNDNVEARIGRDDSYEDDDDGQPDSADDDYFAPVQPVGSAEETHKHLKFPPGFAERLMQKLFHSTTIPPAPHADYQSDPQLQTFAASGIVILILIVITCCILPCIYYMFYDPELCKSLRRVYKETKARTLGKLGLRPTSYTELVNEDDEEDEVEHYHRPEKRRKHHQHQDRPRKSRKSSERCERRIEIPLPSDDSLDICITTDEESHRGGRNLFSDELDVGEQSHRGKQDQRKNDQFGFDNKKDPCAFEPIHHAPRPHPQDRTSKLNKKPQGNRFLGTDSLSTDEEQEIYSRYKDPYEHRHDYLNTEDDSGDGDDPVLKAGRPIDNNFSIEERIHRSAQEDLDYKKSKVYDNLIKQWKYTNSITNLGPQPPPRKTKNHDPLR